jgi:hypothetical protein
MCPWYIGYLQRLFIVSVYRWAGIYDRFLIVVVPNTMHGWERKNQSACQSGRGPKILEREETVS